MHKWPKANEHLWGRWNANTSREGLKPATEWRKCVHPDCDAVEYRDV